MTDKPIIEKTVILLGAGASNPYGFPTGNELIKNILGHEERGRFYFDKKFGTEQILGFDSLDHLFEILNVTDKAEQDDWRKRLENFPTTCIDGNQFRFFRNFIEGLKLYRNSQIDYFLRSHSQYQEFGKIMIARSILAAEHTPQQNIVKGGLEPKEDWIGTFFAILIQKVRTPQDLKTISQNLTIITFNYDLLFEYYLDQFCRGDDEWGKALEEFKKDLRIIHIYGKLGRFDWESENNLKKIYDEEIFKSFAVRASEKQFGFLRDDINCSQINDLASGIKVIGGSKHQEADLKHVKLASGAIAGAEKIFFLGFGFDHNNLTLLRVEKANLKGKKIFYTIFEEDECERIEMVINERIKTLEYAKKLELENANQAALYGIFRKSKKIDSLLKLYL